MTSSRIGAFLTAAALLVCAGRAAAQAPAAPPDPVNIGLVQTLFVDVPEPLMNLLMKPFAGLMRDLTGLNGKATPAGDCYAIAQKLEERQLHLGCFQGFEFAWAQQKYPKLKPLMIAIYYERHLRASMIVHKDSVAATIRDLKGKDLALPLGSKGHCRLFLQRHCVDGNGLCDPKNFFNQVLRPEHTEAALDMVCDGKAHGAVIDDVSFETYKGVRAGAAKRLRVLERSEIFPAGVIAYYDDGSLNAATLNQITQGLVAATKNRKAQEIMSIFKITSFEPIPEDYGQTLADILRAYPPPEAAANPARTATGRN